MKGGSGGMADDDKRQTKFQKMMNQTYEILSGLSPKKTSTRNVADSLYSREDSRDGGVTKTNVLKPLRLDHLI